MSTSTTKEAPHQVVVLVRYENYPRDAAGRCLPRPTTRGSQIFTFNGSNHEEAEAKLQEFLKRLENNANESS